MDKREKAYLLQRIDCSCNDCGFMDRHMGQLNDARCKRDEMQKDSFERLRESMKDKAEYWDAHDQPHKAEVLREEIKKMKYQYESPPDEIHYGYCTKFDKPVTFIPNTCQI